MFIMHSICIDKKHPPTFAPHSPLNSPTPLLRITYEPPSNRHRVIIAWLSRDCRVIIAWFPNHSRTNSISKSPLQATKAPQKSPHRTAIEPPPRPHRTTITPPPSHFYVGSTI